MSDDESDEDAEFTGGEEEEEEVQEDEGEQEEDKGEDTDGDEEEEDEAGNDSADDEEPEESSGRKAKREISYAEDSDDGDDSEDDIPLAQLAAAGKKAAKKKADDSNGKKKNGKKEASPAKKKAKVAASKKAATVIATATDKSYEHASAAMYGTECDKGLLIQRLLCRWWYAYEWPTNIQDEPPENYDPLEGFKGVFICTAGDDAGNIMDTRDAAARPSFVNFARKPSSELKEMLLKAIDGQVAALEANQHMHDTTSLQKELKETRRWAAKVNADKADKEAEKVLKAAKLKLPEIPGS